MPSLLVINPNTSVPVSGLLQAHVQEEVGQAAQVRTVGARFGAAYIASEATYAVAQHAVLDAWAVHLSKAERPDALLSGCSGDRGPFPRREGAGVRVSGLAEAPSAAAAAHGRFAVVTGGERWRPMLARLAHALGYGDALAGIHTVAPSGAELAADPQGARLVLAGACQEAVERFGAQAVVLGGAGLAGMAADIEHRLSVPLVDSVRAGAQWALQALQARERAPDPANEGRFGVAWENLSWEMGALP